MQNGRANLFGSLYAALVVGISARTFFFFPATVPTSSMEPAILKGDTILVDRLTLAFRRPRRGEIVVFTSPNGISGLPVGRVYVKRLVALGGESVRIGTNWMVEIDGRLLTAGAPGFEGLYAFAERAPRPGEFHGHANQSLLQEWGGEDVLSPRFADENARVQIGRDCVLVLGDNTLVSYDSRAWGDLPMNLVVGRAVLLSRRFF